jgi:hypothetical protein
MGINGKQSATIFKSDLRIGFPVVNGIHTNPSRVPAGFAVHTVEYGEGSMPVAMLTRAGSATSSCQPCGPTRQRARIFAGLIYYQSTLSI